ncbi:MAG: glycosyltransferase family 4 protein [Candidatus Berkelbacteria bacterium]|nr:glycosyltransferase family 4 protein [Candidatus Berkelbacteria bacterium]
MTKNNFKIGLPFLSPGKNDGQGVFEETFAAGLKKRGVNVEVFYPTNKDLNKIDKIGSVLSMASMREHISEAKKCDLLYSTNGISLSLSDKEVGVPMFSVFHSTTRTLFEHLTGDYHKMAEYALYQKYYKELDKLALVTDEMRRASLETWALMEDQMIKKSHYIVAVSDKVKREIDNYLLPKNKKIQVVHNGIEESWFTDEKYVDCKRCQKITKKWASKPTVMWVGRTGREHNTFKTKGLDRVLELFDRLDSKKVNKVVIAIVPKERKEYVARYGKLFTKRGIEFIPNCPYTHLPHLTSKGDIFIMPSRYEGFSLSLIEAMASKMAPIAYSVGVVPEAIKNGYNGYIVKNIDQMEERVKYLVANPKRRQQIAEHAFESAEKNYQIEYMLEKYFALFKKITRRRKLVL